MRQPPDFVGCRESGRRQINAYIEQQQSTVSVSLQKYKAVGRAHVCFHNGSAMPAGMLGDHTPSRTKLGYRTGYLGHYHIADRQGDPLEFIAVAEKITTQV